MNSKDKFAVEVLIEVYKLLPLQGVLTDYWGAIYNIGDTVCVRRPIKGTNALPIRPPKPYICLAIDKSIYVPIWHPAEDTARAIVEKIVQRTPPPWKAFATTCKIYAGTNMVHCLYGVKYKKRPEDKELKEKLARAERALINAGYTDKGGAMWKPPVDTDAAKLWQRVFLAEDRCGIFQNILADYEKIIAKFIKQSIC